MVTTITRFKFHIIAKVIVLFGASPSGKLTFNVLKWFKNCKTIKD